MKKKNIIIAGFLLTLLGGYIIWSNFLKTSPSTSKLKTELEVSAIDLYAAFDEDEEKANTVYLNKVIEITGVVTKVDQSDNLKPSVNLETNGFGAVVCTFETLEDFNADLVNIGDPITIKGQCIGLLLDVLVNNSIIIKD